MIAQKRAGAAVTAVVFSTLVSAIAVVSSLYWLWGGVVGYPRVLTLLPPIGWLGLFVYALAHFRWRGLWFFAGLPIALAGLLGVFVKLCVYGTACFGRLP